MDQKQWKEVEQALSHPYGRARLLADGHTLDMIVERGKGLRYVVAVYIDGVIEWKHSISKEDGPHRKFWRSRKIYIASAAKRAEYASLAKKRGMPADLKKMYAEWAASSREIFVPTFPSAAALCRHLRKTCASVELAPAEVPA